MKITLDSKALCFLLIATLNTSAASRAFADEAVVDLGKLPKPSQVEAFVTEGNAPLLIPFAREWNTVSKQAFEVEATDFDIEKLQSVDGKNVAKQFATIPSDAGGYFASPKAEEDFTKIFQKAEELNSPIKNMSKRDIFKYWAITKAASAEVQNADPNQQMNTDPTRQFCIWIFSPCVPYPAPPKKQ